jgi:DNA-binding MarR family transcriptional regulator
VAYLQERYPADSVASPLGRTRSKIWPQVEVLTEASKRTDVEAAPVRSVRRATARRASHRRATARSRHRDSETSIIDFLARHPGSTVGDLARGLNVNPETVSIRLTQLAQCGEIKKSATATTRTRRHDLARNSAHTLKLSQPEINRDPSPVTRPGRSTPWSIKTRGEAARDACQAG